MEQRILLRELEAMMTPDERWIFEQKAFGYSSEEIARAKGCSVNAVDQVMSRLRRKIRALAGVKE
jgi:DNA-directed RNA polymerase specialized sigma24 family protein